MPVFYVAQYINSKYSDFVLDNTKLLKDKGLNGFNKYMTFAGYVDEDEKICHMELFQMIISYECRDEYVLI